MSGWWRRPLPVVLNQLLAPGSLVPPPRSRPGHFLPLFRSKTSSKSSSRSGQICSARCGGGERRLAGTRGGRSCDDHVLVSGAEERGRERGGEYCDLKERLLTVRKTSHFFPGDGFAAYDHRTVASPSAPTPAAAATAAARPPPASSRSSAPPASPSSPCAAVARPCTSADGQKSLFSARRSSILGGAGRGAVIELSASAAAELRVDGSFARRCCRVVARGEDGEETVVAEIRRKVDEVARVVMGRDVFVLRVGPGFDAAFAMGIVLVLDQIAGDAGAKEVALHAKIW